MIKKIFIVFACILFIAGITRVQAVEGKGKFILDTNLEGSVYEIYDMNDELIGTYKTDSSKMITIDELDAGNYRIKQIEVAERI